MIRDLVLMKLEAVGLRGAQAMLPAELSGGMARRAALARAVVLDPMLVMYDEPFAGLDPIALAVIGQLVRKLNDALGATSIIVTHDVLESLQIVDYLYFIADGVIVGEGHAGAGPRLGPPLRSPVRARRDRRAGAVPLPGTALCGGSRPRRGRRACLKA